jgi:hypothetical protein
LREEEADGVHEEKNEMMKMFLRKIVNGSVWKIP